MTTGDELYVKEGGVADSKSGKTYYHVGKEDAEGDLHIYGWSDEIDHPIESAYEGE